MAVLSLNGNFASSIEARKYMEQFAEKLHAVPRRKLLALLDTLTDAELVDFVDMFKSVRPN